MKEAKITDKKQDKEMKERENNIKKIEIKDNDAPDNEQDHMQNNEAQVDKNTNESKGSSNSEDELAKCQEQLRQLQSEYEAYKERFLRHLAETDNLRKRLHREKVEFEKRANEKLIKDILPILDNLTWALETVEHAKGLPKDFIKGIKMVEQEFLKVLEKYGAIPVKDPVNKPFDPNVHEALHTVETEDVPPGTVVKQINRGFILNNRLLRPARVLVATEPENTVPEYQLDNEMLEDSDNKEDSQNN